MLEVKWALENIAMNKASGWWCHKYSQNSFHRQEKMSESMLTSKGTLGRQHSGLDTHVMKGSEARSV